MPRPEVTIPERARGALLGHAAGNALGVPTEFLGTAEAIERAYDGIAMSVHLAEELLEPEPDLERLSKRWVRWMEEDGRGIGGWTRTAITPPAPVAPPGSVAPQR